MIEFVLLNILYLKFASLLTVIPNHSNCTEQIINSINNPNRPGRESFVFKHRLALLMFLAVHYMLRKTKYKNSNKMWSVV